MSGSSSDGTVVVLIALLVSGCLQISGADDITFVRGNGGAGGNPTDASSVGGAGGNATDASSVGGGGGNQDAASGSAGTALDASKEGSSLSCGTGLGDCDLQVANGCETDLLENNDNCGYCGHRCADEPQAKHGYATDCDNGVCVRQCYDGFADCDGDWLGTGCETQLGDGTKNCAKCGDVCPEGFECREAWGTVACMCKDDAACNGGSPGVCGPSSVPSGTTCYCGDAGVCDYKVRCLSTGECG